MLTKIRSDEQGQGRDTRGRTMKGKGREGKKRLLDSNLLSSWKGVKKPGGSQGKEVKKKAR